MERVAPHEFDDRLIVIIDGDRHMTVVERSVTAVSSQHQQCGRLLAPDVTACSLARFETCHQPFGKGRARALEGPHHLIDNSVARKTVAERDAVATDAAACPTVPRTQSGAGVDGRPPGPVQQGELSLPALGVAAE